LLTGTYRLPNSDLSGQFHAFALFQAREMAAGRFPLWSPGSYSGIPFAADTQAAVFYPPRLLTILISLPWGFSFYLLELEGLLHIWLAGLFTYLLVQHITGRRVAGLVAAVAFGLGGYLTTYPLLQLAILETVTWLPLVLWLIRRARAGERPLPSLLAAGLVLGMVALAGHPQTFLHISYLAAAYYLFQMWQARWNWRWCLGGGLATAATAAGTAMAAWLPAAHYLSLSTRSEVTYRFVAGGQPLLHYLQTIVPNTFSLWQPEYVGITTVCLALLAWLGRKIDRKATSEILFWLMAAFIAAWIALGDKGIIFELVYRIAPGFSLFRQQERLVGLFNFGLAILAGQGVALWLSADGAMRRRLSRQVAVIVGSSLLLVGLILFGASPLVADDWWLVWGRQWLITAVTLTLLWGFARTRLRLFLLVILLLLDLYLAVQPALNLKHESPAVFWPQPAWLTKLQATPGRLDSSNLFHANIGEIYGLEDIRSLSPLKLQSVDRFQQLPRQLRWQLLNVTRLLSWENAPQAWQSIETFTGSLIPGEPMTAFVYGSQRPSAYAWMSYQPILVPDAGSAFQQLQDRAIDPAVQVLLEDAGVDMTAVSLPAAPPQIQYSRRSPQQLSITVTTETAGILVISEWAYPGWHARLDGTRVELLTANFALQGLLIPPGTHTVEMQFLPLDVILGLILSLFTLITAVSLTRLWHPTPHPSPLPPHPSFPTPHPSPLAPRPSPLLSRLFPHLLLLITLLAFVLRLPNLGSQELRGDEAFSYLFARLPLADVIPALINDGDPHSPLHYLLLHGWMALAGHSEWAMRYISLLPAVLLIPLVGQLGLRLGGHKLGLLTAICLAISQSQIWIAQDVRNQYTLALFFSTLATLLFLRALRRRWLWLLYGLVSALTIYSHYYGIFALLGHALYLLVSRQERRQLWYWLGSGLLAAILFLPWLVAIFPSLLSAGQLSDPDTPEMAAYLTTVGLELLAGPAYPGSPPRWLFLGAIILLVTGAKTFPKQTQPTESETRNQLLITDHRTPITDHRATVAMLLGWLGSAVLIIYLVRFSRSTFNDFYITVAAPAWWLLIANGLLTLWRRWWGVGLLLLGLIAIATASLNSYYTNPAAQRLSGYRGMAAHIERELAEGDVFLANAPDPALVYYLESLPLPYTMQPATSAATAADTEAALAQLTADYERIWFVPAPTSSWDTTQVAARWLDYHLLHEQEGQYHSLTLQAYRPLRTAGGLIQPINSRLNGAIDLLGSYVTVNGRPVKEAAQVSGAAEMEVTLLWQTKRPIAENYTVFVHLVAENGALVAQHDGVPLFGTRPTTTWQPGEAYPDLHTLSIPAAADFTTGQLLVGLYHSETIERQLFDNGRETVPLLTVNLAP
jgi:4-amino-4-deoxy-L-arabinose transferase-like glycosyltransferase